MTAWHALIDRARLQLGERLALFGCGGLGLSVLQIAVAAGARVMAVDLDPVRRAQALAHGAEAALDPAAGPVVEAVVELTRGGADLSPWTRWACSRPAHRPSRACAAVAATCNWA
jgi:Zn-dependent alcohol dehydrogenase